MAAATRSTAQPLTARPLAFEEWRRGEFLVRSAGFTMGLTQHGIEMRLLPAHERLVLQLAAEQGDAAQFRSAPVGEERQPGVSHYYLGSDPKQWREGIAHFGQVRYRAVYPGVDLVFHGNGRELEFDFVLAPGADPGQIAFSFSGARKIDVDASGDLRIVTASGTLVQHAPQLYQMTQDGRRQAVAGRYVRRSDRRIGFSVARYDHRRTLTVDPVLSYATYLGGTGSDAVNQVGVDGAGHIFLAGLTKASDFPAVGSPLPPNPEGGYGLAYIAKLSADGTTLLSTTFFTASWYTPITGMVVDPAGNIYITGNGSSLAPVTANAYQTTGNSTSFDSYVLKFNSSGQVVYGTYLGGPVTQYALSARGIAVDAAGRAYITGTIGGSAARYPVTPGAYQRPVATDGGIFVSALNPAGTALAYSTLLGGTDSAAPTAVAITPAGNVVVSGIVYATYPNPAVKDFPVTPGAVQTTGGGSTDGFVLQMPPALNALTFSTLLGGRGADVVNALAVDPSGNMYVTGGTKSTDFPTTPGAYQVSPRSGFVTKLAANSGSLLYSTYFGVAASNCGTSAFFGVDSGLAPCDTGAAIAVDSSGRAYITGTTAAPDFPATAGAFQTQAANRSYYDSDAFLLVLSAAGGSAEFATPLGGSDFDAGTAIALDAAGNVLVAGDTTSTNFPVTGNAVQPISGTTASVPMGTSDAFLAKITLDHTVCSVSVSTTPLAFNTVGASGGLFVTAPPGCPWSAYADEGTAQGTWLIVSSGASGVGNGSVGFGVAINYSNEAHAGRLVIAGQSIPVTQTALPCTLTVQPNATTIPVTGGSGSFHVTSPWGCDWNPFTTSPWISIGNLTNGPNNGGDADVPYTVQPNPGPSRTGTIQINNLTYTVVQPAAGCTYSLPTASGSYTGAAQTVSVALTAGAGCGWTATSPDAAAWVHPASSSGSGSAQLAVTLDLNPSNISRTGTLTIGGQTFTITQAGGCSYQVSPTTFNIPSGSSSIVVTVTTGANCTWTEASDSPWIPSYPNAPQYGTLTNTIGIPSNGGPPRTGTLTLAGQTVTVNQAGNPNAFYVAGDSPLFNTSAAFSVTAGDTTPQTRTLTLSPVSAPQSLTVTVLPDNGPVFVSPSIASGVTPTTLTLTVQSAGLAPGAYQNTVLLNEGSYLVQYPVTLVVQAATPAVSKAGVYRDTTGLVLLDRNGDGICCSGDRISTMGMSGDVPLAGDWNGDGRKKFGLYRPSTGLFLLDLNNDGVFTSGVDKAFTIAPQTGDLPVVGDWSGTGQDRVGIFRAGTWYLDQRADGSFTGRAYLGQAGDIPLVGNWSGVGSQTNVAIYRPNSVNNQPGNFFLVDRNGDGLYTSADPAPFFFGQAGDIPLVGDWNGDGKAKVGLFRPAGAANGAGLLILDQNGNLAWDGASTDRVLYFGPFVNGLSATTSVQPGDLPITGNWVTTYGGAGTVNLAGQTRTGLYRPSTGTFFLDISGDGTYQGRAYLGQTGDVPVGLPVFRNGVVVGVNGLGSF